MDKYRPSDSDKWNDKRYRQLTFEQKAVYDYLWDRADNAGFYKFSDTEMDILRLGPDMRDEDQLRSAIKSLCKPKESPDGKLHRGFIAVKPYIWCSHLIKKTQNQFGKRKDNRHKPILTILIDMYEFYNGEPEYRELIESVDMDVWQHFKLDNPLTQEKLAETSVPTATKPKTPIPVPSNVFDDIIKYFNETTGLDIMLSQIRIKLIKDRLRESNVNDIKKVIEFKNSQWKDDPKMSKHITLETLLKDEHFMKYLDESKKPTNGQQTKGTFKLYD